MFLRIKIHLRLFGDFFSTHFCSVRPESYTFVRLHEIQFAGNLVTYGVCWWTIVAGELSAGLCYKRTTWLGRRRENYSYVDSCVTNAKIELERSSNPAHFLIPAQLTSQGVKWAWMLDYSVLEKVTEAFGRRPSNSDVVKAKVEGVTDAVHLTSSTFTGWEILCATYAILFCTKKVTKLNTQL